MSYLRLFPLVALLAAAACTGCVTVPPVQLPGCRAAVRAAFAEYASNGLQLVGAIAHPTGEMATFSDGAVVRRLYVAFAPAVAEFVQSQGWARRTDCRADAGPGVEAGDVYTLLEFTSAVPHDAPAEASK